MSTIVRRGSVGVLLVIFAACGSSGVTAPTGTGPPNAPGPVSEPAPLRDFPPLSGPSRTFVFDRELSYPVSGFTTKSSFVLYDNGAFGLHYLGIEHVYRGAYQELNGVIMFLFQWGSGRSVAEPWNDATGTLDGQSLTVRYKESMQHADFEDARYVLVP